MVVLHFLQDPILTRCPIFPVTTNFLQYLEGELGRIVPRLLLSFKHAMDAVSINKDTLRSSLTKQIDTEAQKTGDSFANQVLTFKVTSQGPKNRVDKALEDLNRGIQDERKARVGRLEKLVASWNRMKLNDIVNPIIRETAEFILDSSGKLNSAIDNAKVQYFGAACGSQEEQESVGSPLLVKRRLVARQLGTRFLMLMPCLDLEHLQREDG